MLIHSHMGSIHQLHNLPHGASGRYTVFPQSLKGQPLICMYFIGYADNVQKIASITRESEEKFFLWGPRLSGKTTLLKACCYPDALRIYLLKTDKLVRYAKAPSLLREEAAVLSTDLLMVIDEIQKAPGLLYEIYYMIQVWQRVFAL